MVIIFAVLLSLAVLTLMVGLLVKGVRAYVEYVEIMRDTESL